MRRISLAVALVGALAAAGCGGGAKPAAQNGAQGTAGVNYTLTVNKQGPGRVVSSPAGIDCTASMPNSGIAPAGCSANFATGVAVTLTATADAGKFFNGWYGGCEGTASCTLSGQADKYVVAYFSDTAQAHGNWAKGADHGPQYRDFVAGAAGALNCKSCHGTELKGLGIAPSCTSCHPLSGYPTSTGDKTWATAVPSLQVGHFDSAAEPWGSHSTGWSQACQRCHTNDGFLDFIGADGTPNLNAVYPAALQGDATATTPPGGAGYANGPLKCSTCHNATTQALTTITFPSGKKVTADGAAAICGQCHGARESTASVNAKIGATAADVAISPAQGFINPHYLGAAATLFGGDAQGWAEYPNKVYTKANKHGGVASCTDCHNAHNGEIEVSATTCGKCHFNEAGAPVANFLELEESRQFGFEGDIDGDGNATESLKAEIDGLAAKVYTAMQTYAANVVGKSIAYSDAYPYFYDTSVTPNVAYPKVMTPRLLRATFNYKWYKADPGAWAHNPRYAIEVLYDTLFDLNEGIRADVTAPTGTAVDTSAVRGSFTGHFGSSGFAAEPYAQWLYHPAAGSFYGTRGTGFTGNTCFQCHGGNGGLGAYLTAAPMAPAASSDCIGNAPCALPTGSQPTQAATPRTLITFSNRVTGLQCATCHVDAANMKGLRSDVTTLYVPPQKGAVGTNGVVSFNAADLPAGFIVCASCHTGLENMASVDVKIAAATEPQAIGFVNGHYYGAAGIILGSDAKVLYEYPSKTYQGKAVNFAVGTANGPHGSPHGARCTGCHDPQQSKHSFEIDENVTVVKGTFYGAPNTKTCNECHVLVDATHDYRLAPAKANLQQLGADLLTAIQAYAWTRTGATKNDGTTLANPYYFATGTGAGICYSGAVYPYFIRHNAATGDCTAQELTNVSGGYQVRTNGGYAFDAKLLKAAYNYQWFVKDPGAAEHNFLYMGQVLFDSIEDLGGTTAETRP